MLRWRLILRAGALALPALVPPGHLFSLPFCLPVRQPELGYSNPSIFTRCSQLHIININSLHVPWGSYARTPNSFTVRVHMGITLFTSNIQPPMRQQLFSNLQQQHTIVKTGSEDKYRIHLKLQEGIGVGRI